MLALFENEGGSIGLAKLTVNKTRQSTRNNPIYVVEAIEYSEGAPCGYVGRRDNRIRRDRPECDPIRRSSRRLSHSV